MSRTYRKFRFKHNDTPNRNKGIRSEYRGVPVSYTTVVNLEKEAVERRLLDPSQKQVTKRLLRRTKKQELLQECL